MVEIHRSTKVTAACAAVALTVWYVLETYTNQELLGALVLLGVGIVLPILVNRRWSDRDDEDGDGSNGGDGNARDGHA